MVSDAGARQEGAAVFLRWVAMGILAGLLLFFGANVYWSVEFSGEGERLVSHLVAMAVIGLAVAGLAVQVGRGAVCPPIVLVLILWTALVLLNLFLRLDFASFTIAGRMVLWALVGMFFYYVGYYAILTPRAVKRFAAATIILVSARVLYLLWQTGFSMMRGDLGFREVMNKNSFIILWTSPVCYFGSVTLLYRLLFFLSCSVVVLTLKRTAMLALVVGLLIYALCHRKRQRAVRFRFGKQVLGGGVNFRAVFMALTGLVVMSVFAAYRWEDVQHRFSMEAKYGFSHGRELFWPIIMDEIKRGSIIEWLAGRGILQVPKIWDSSLTSALHAHNEWIELLYDFGIIGCAVYALVFIVLIQKTVLLLSERNFPVGIPLAMICSSILISGLFGTYFHRVLFAWAILFATFMIGFTDRTRQEQTVSSEPASVPPAPPPGFPDRNWPIPPAAGRRV